VFQFFDWISHKREVNLLFEGVWRCLKFNVDGIGFWEKMPWEAEEYLWEPVQLLKTNKENPRFLRRVENISMLICLLPDVKVEGGKMKQEDRDRLYHNIDDDSPVDYLGEDQQDRRIADLEEECAFFLSEIAKLGERIKKLEEVRRVGGPNIYGPGNTI